MSRLKDVLLSINLTYSRKDGWIGFSTSIVHFIFCSIISQANALCRFRVSANALQCVDVKFCFVSFTVFISSVMIYPSERECIIQIK